MSEALILYTRENCGLCDTAATMAAVAGIAIDPIDIAGDLVLLERYRDAIPVFRDPASGAELRWPFDIPAVIEFRRRPRASGAVQSPR